MASEASSGLGLGVRRVVVLFGVVLVLYLMAFHGIEHMRHRKGPWVVEFSRNEAGDPAVVVSQGWLGIESVALQFPGERAESVALPQRVAFERPGRGIPFGEVLYEDLTFLPGVVTFNLFGHEVELLPRVLLINKREVPWESGRVISLDPEAKPAPPPRPPVGRRRVQ